VEQSNPTPTVQAQAAEVGRRAAWEYELNHQAWMRAIEAEREREPHGAYWLANDPCPSWCAYSSGHSDSDHPSDRWHGGPAEITRLNTMDPIALPGDRIGPPEVHVALHLNYREAEARVNVSDIDGGRFNLYLTLDEAEQHARQLLALVAEARGSQWTPTITPFDADGRCQDRTCINCYGSEVQA
jgi:hypothetical protein